MKQRRQNKLSREKLKHNKDRGFLRKRGRSSEEVDAANEFIFLNVGGTKFVTTLATLASEPESLLNKWFTDPEHRIPTDEEGNYFIDRDAAIFGIILNLLRGYRVKIEADLVSQLYIDLDYFGLSNLKAALGLESREPLRFMQSSGVSADGRRISSGLIVRLCGDSPMRTGVHKITFSITQGPFIGIGVVPENFLGFDSDFGTMHMCAAYYSDGSVRSNFQCQNTTENGQPFEPGDHITVVLNLAQRTLIWLRKDKEVGNVSFRDVNSGIAFRFATVLKSPAVLNIVQN